MSFKHAEFIYAVTSGFIDKSIELIAEGFGFVPYEEWLKEAESKLVLRQRRHLEQDSTYRQLLPYVVLKHTDEQGVVRYATYQRCKGIGEDRLLGKCSLGFGGHIDLQDTVTMGMLDGEQPDNADSIVDLRETIANNVIRELDEEVNVQYDGFGFQGFIVDDSDDVGQHHLGLLFEADLNHPVQYLPEEELKFLGMLTLDEIVASGLEFENWTNIVIEQLAKTASVQEVPVEGQATANIDISA